MLSIMKSNLIKETAKYFDEKVVEHGCSPLGVDWNSEEAQNTRLDQVLKILPETVSGEISINDIGSGYGAVIPLLETIFEGTPFKYFGYDISKEMVNSAGKEFDNKANIKFSLIEGLEDISSADYSIASGIFNMKQGFSDEEWLQYIFDSLNIINEFSVKGFSFNMLTHYSDKDYMRSDLYYADCCKIFDYCKKTFSRNVALLHDYDLYDFTILVRK